MARTVRFAIGAALLPFVWAATTATLTLVPDALTAEFPFVSRKILFFSAGVAVWCAIAWRFMVNNWFYIFGHELTHAAWALLTFSKVTRISVTAKGGYCLIENPGPFTTLAPYFVPFYAVVLLLARLLLGIWVDMASYSHWWLAALGFAYGFHATNTVESLTEVAQPDIREYGKFFSCTLIIAANLLFLGLGAAAMLGVPLLEWLSTLLDSCVSAYCAAWRGIAWAVATAFTAVKGVIAKQ